MKITLRINKEEKTFTAPFVSARKLKETIKLSVKVQNGVGEELMDELIDYEVSLYGNQFTADELLDGYPSSGFFNKIFEDLENVIGEFNTSIKN